MKKVVCITISIDGNTLHPEGPKVEKGRVYNVMDQKYFWLRDNYQLLETGDWWFSAAMFIDLIEDQQDETCFVRDYNKETV